MPLDRIGPLVHLRGSIARALVRWSSRWWQASYQATERTGRWNTIWSKGASRVDHIAIPLASRLDRRAAGEQMVEECWWG